MRRNVVQGALVFMVLAVLLLLRLETPSRATEVSATGGSATAATHAASARLRPVSVSAWPASASPARWDEAQIVAFLAAHPDRAFFSRLFAEGGFRSGMEVGVAGGRFSEHFLLDNSALEAWTWYMIEPFPNGDLKRRAGINEHGLVHFGEGSWARRGIGANAHKMLVQELSTDARLVRDLGDHSFDFIYLDGAHDYENVKKELVLYWPKIRPGGVLAGHDYATHGEKPPLKCRGCQDVPRSKPYTEISGKPNEMAKTQQGVVSAVQEWLVEEQPQLRLHHTLETFTRESLEAAGMDYDLVVTKTRNPSWFVVKPR